MEYFAKRAEYFSKLGPYWELVVKTGLLVHLELGVAVLKEGVDLLSSCDAGVDVGLGCLSTHLLWC